ncbi:MAG: ThiF family adenylyltransferase [Thermoplasmata archaeon]|jgi:molybdopterin/thiamine biosynthesis adenylyltransferase|nr:ThiF family adenylyltransferase [Thermoplasmata archaeon]
MEDFVRVGAADNDRYDRSRRIEWLDLERLFRSDVLLVGAGALGNEVAKNLVLSGFRNITVVDMDRVVGSNLSRCMFFTEEDAEKGTYKAEAVARGMQRLSSDAVPKALVAKVEDLPPVTWGGRDVVLGCLDNIQARLHVNSHAYPARIPLVDGGMDGFIGKVTVVRPPDGACLQCGMNRTHAKVAEMRFSCTGSGIVFHQPRVPAEITTTSVVSAVMVREAMKIVSGRSELLLSNAFYYDGKRNVSEEIEFPVNPQCPLHAAGPHDYK